MCVFFFFSQSDVGSAGQQRQVDEAYGTMGSNNGNNTLRSNISTGSGSSSSVVTVIAAPNTDDGRLDLYCKPLFFSRKMLIHNISRGQLCSPYLFIPKVKYSQTSILSIGILNRRRQKNFPGVTPPAPPPPAVSGPKGPGPGSGPGGAYGSGPGGQK